MISSRLWYIYCNVYTGSDWFIVRTTLGLWAVFTCVVSEDNCTSSKHNIIIIIIIYPHKLRNVPSDLFSSQIITCHSIDKVGLRHRQQGLTHRHQNNFQSQIVKCRWCDRTGLIMCYQSAIFVYFLLPLLEKSLAKIQDMKRLGEQRGSHSKLVDWILINLIFCFDVEN